MEKGKIDKKALKRDELITFTQHVLNYAKTYPKRVTIIAIAITIPVIFGISGFFYFREKKAEANLKFTEGLHFFQVATRTASTDKSTSILHYSKCIEIFENFLKNYPRNSLAPFAGLYLGEANFRLGRQEEAINIFQRVLKKYRQNPSAGAIACLSLGYAYENQSDWKNAVQFYEKLVSEFPDSFLVTQAYLRLGHCYQRLSNYDRAKNCYNKVLQLEKDSIWAREAREAINKIG